MMWRQRFILGMLIILAWSSLAVADDFMPPEFRGGELTVMAEWDFTADFTAPPFNYYNYTPDNLTTVGDGIHELGDAFTHAHFSETMFWRQGEAYTLDAPGQIDFYLVNWIDNYPYKHIWVQITFSGQGAPYVGSVVGPNANDNSWVNPTYGTPEFSIDVDLNHRVEYWVLRPNPDREHIYLEVPPFTTVEQIVIDTISTPSPVSSEETTFDGLKALYR